MRLFRYINISRKVYKEIKKQKQYNKSLLVSYLHELENKYGITMASSSLPFYAAVTQGCMAGNLQMPKEKGLPFLVF